MVEIRTLSVGTTIGDYTVKKQLGEGGQFGIPFLVESNEGDKVLKVFK